MLNTPKRHNQLIHKAFRYLFDEFGFEIFEVRTFPSFANWVAVLISEDCCRIKLLKDRTELVVLVGPVWSPPGWESGPFYDIDVIFKALGEETIYKADKYWNEEEKQLEEISRIIKPIMPKICDLFSGEHYEKNSEKLELIYKKILDDWQFN